MILLEKSCFFSCIIDFLMGTWMLIKYENTSMPAIFAFQILNQSQFIIMKDWELGYCPDETQIERNIWKSDYKRHKIPLSSPTWAQRTNIHRELLIVMERGRRNVNNLPLLTSIKTKITKRLCRDGIHEKKYRPHTGKYAELTQTDGHAFFFSDLFDLWLN